MIAINLLNLVKLIAFREDSFIQKSKTVRFFQWFVFLLILKKRKFRKNFIILPTRRFPLKENKKSSPKHAKFLIISAPKKGFFYLLFSLASFRMELLEIGRNRVQCLLPFSFFSFFGFLGSLGFPFLGFPFLDNGKNRIVSFEKNQTFSFSQIFSKALKYQQYSILMTLRDLFSFDFIFNFLSTSMFIPTETTCSKKVFIGNFRHNL